MKKAENPPLTRAITDFVSKTPVTCQEVEQVFLLVVPYYISFLWEENVMLQD